MVVDRYIYKYNLGDNELFAKVFSLGKDVLIEMIKVRADLYHLTYLTHHSIVNLRPKEMKINLTLKYFEGIYWCDNRYNCQNND